MSILIIIISQSVIWIVYLLDDAKFERKIVALPLIFVGVDSLVPPNGELIDYVCQLWIEHLVFVFICWTLTTLQSISAIVGREWGRGGGGGLTWIHFLYHSLLTFCMVQFLGSVYRGIPHDIIFYFVKTGKRGMFYLTMH